MDKGARRNLSIIIFNQDMTEVGKFNVKNAMIVKYSGPAYNSTNSEVTFETVEMVYDYFEYEPASMADVAMGQGMNAIAGKLGI